MGTNATSMGTGIGITGRNNVGTGLFANQGNNGMMGGGTGTVTDTSTSPHPL